VHTPGIALPHGIRTVSSGYNNAMAITLAAVPAQACSAGEAAIAPVLHTHDHHATARTMAGAKQCKDM